MERRRGRRNSAHDRRWPPRRRAPWTSTFMRVCVGAGRTKRLDHVCSVLRCGAGGTARTKPPKATNATEARVERTQNALKNRKAQFARPFFKRRWKPDGEGKGHPARQWTNRQPKPLTCCPVRSRHSVETSIAHDALPAANTSRCSIVIRLLLRPSLSESARVHGTDEHCTHRRGMFALPGLRVYKVTDA
jgi:hypothetical protein